MQVNTPMLIHLCKYTHEIQQQYLYPVVFCVSYRDNTDQHRVPSIDGLQPVVHLETMWSSLIGQKQLSVMTGAV